MMVGYAVVRDAAPRFLNPNRNWSGKCEAAAFNLANVLTPGPVRTFPDATSARKASTIEGPGLGQGNNWVWMSGVWGTENGRRVDWGHVAYHVGAGLLFMASSSVTDRIPGMTALGFIDGLTYLRRFSGQKLEGWSYDHGGTTIPGDGPIVVPAPHIERGEDMALTEDQLEERFAALRARAEDTRDIAKANQIRSTNIENKVDLILDSLGVPREQFPPAAS